MLRSRKVEFVTVLHQISDAAFVDKISWTGAFKQAGLMSDQKHHRLTLSPPAVKSQFLSQCQAFQRFVRSSHILVNWIVNNFWSTQSIFNQFSVFLKTLNVLCVCLQYKHPRSKIRVIRSDKPVTWVFPVKSQKCDFGAEPRCRLIVTSTGQGLNLYVHPVRQFLTDFCTIFTFQMANNYLLLPHPMGCTSNV
jgi:hypothetical protein